MSFLNFIQRNAALIAVPVFLLSALFLAFCIRGLVGLGRTSQLCRLPLLEAQSIPVAAPGRVTLSLAGPRLSKRFSELGFELLAADGTRIPASKAWFPSRSSGMAKVSLELMSFTIPNPGPHTLRIHNLGAAREGDPMHAVLLSRPQLLRMVSYILGVVLGAGLLIGSILLLCLRLLPKGVGP